MSFKALKTHLFGLAALGLLTSPIADPSPKPLAATHTVFNTPLKDNTIGKDTLLPTTYTYCDSAKYAMCVMNAKTGEVILSHNPHVQRYPASLVKMITILLALEKIERGEWHMNTQLTVPHMHFTTKDLATAKLQAGQKISVKDALLYTHVVSAADAAETLGCNMVDSQQAFVALMNQKADALGLCNTYFMNASGDRDNFYSADGVGVHKQVSTAYDLALLVKALAAKTEYHDFLATKEVFRPGRKKPYINHALKPTLLAAGAKFGKTGEIDASGKNMAMLFDDNKIVMLFGAHYTPWRTKHVLDLKHAADSLVDLQQNRAWLHNVTPLVPWVLNNTQNYKPPFIAPQQNFIHGYK